MTTTTVEEREADIDQCAEPPTSERADLKARQHELLANLDAARSELQTGGPRGPGELTDVVERVERELRSIQDRLSEPPDAEERRAAAARLATAGREHAEALRRIVETIDALTAALTTEANAARELERAGGEPLKYAGGAGWWTSESVSLANTLTRLRSVVCRALEE